MEIIRSRSNPKIRRARALQQRKSRAESGLFLVEGIHLVGAAVEAGVQIETIFYAPDLLTSQYALDLIEDANSHGLPCYPAAADVFNSLASKEHPQGIIAVVRYSRQQLAALNPQNFSWGVACVSPQDPGNIGTILRTIDAVGASGLLLLDGGVDAYHPTSVRASMGAVFRKPVVSTSFADFVEWAAGHEYQVLGTSAQGSLDFREKKRYVRPLVLLLGEERGGLLSEQREACDLLLRLPIHGKVTSLNLAVAAGIMLYDILAKVDGQ
jgi:TrmH family RNA methyltransferase